MADGQDECRRSFEKVVNDMNMPGLRDDYNAYWSFRQGWQTRAESGLVRELVEALKTVGGCFDAAYVEGLAERLAEADVLDVGSLADLVNRRLLYAVPVIQAALAKAQTAPTEPQDWQPIAGWRLYTADFSRDGAKGSVMLVRDSEGYKWWQSLSEAEQDENALFVTGFGNSIQEAVIDANAKAKAESGAV